MPVRQCRPRSGSTGPVSSAPFLCLIWAGDLWVERGCEVVERDKVSSFPAEGCSKKPRSTASFWAHRLFLLWWVISTMFQGRLCFLQRWKRSVSAVHALWLKAGSHKKMLAFQELRVTAKGSLTQPLLWLQGELIKTAWAPVNVLCYFLVDSAVAKEARSLMKAVMKISADLTVTKGISKKKWVEMKVSFFISRIALW